MGNAAFLLFNAAYQRKVTGGSRSSTSVSPSISERPLFRLPKVCLAKQTKAQKGARTSPERRFCRSLGGGTTSFYEFPKIPKSGEAGTRPPISRSAAATARHRNENDRRPRSTSRLIRLRFNSTSAARILQSCLPKFTACPCGPPSRHFARC